MENKKFIENYIESEVPKSNQKLWAWLVNSELANQDEILDFNPSVIQHALIQRPQKGKLSMNAIIRRYTQLKKVYDYGETHGQVKFNPFSIFELVSLQQSVDLYYLENKERYLTKDNINKFLYYLAEDQKLQKNTSLNLILLLIAAYNGVDKTDILQLKISDFDFDNCLLRLQNGSKKPISREFADAVKYYLWQYDSSFFFGDYLIAGREYYDNLDEYVKAQKAIVATTAQTLKKIGNRLGFGLVQVNDLVHSGFIQHLKANLGMDQIMNIYSVKGLDKERNITSMEFIKTVIGYYYRWSDYYPEGKRFWTQYGNEVIGNTIGYLYRDAEYYRYRDEKLVEETFH